MVSISYTIQVVFFVCIVAYCFEKVNEIVEEPYIDEFFHLRQCRKYCDFKFHEWDSKITTPPGLYILGFLNAFAWKELFKRNVDLSKVCADNGILRSTNIVGGLVFFPLALSLFKGRDKNFQVLSVISSPLIFIYYFLFYTDVWAAVLVVLALAILKRNPVNVWVSSLLASLVSFAGVWMRQTNIIWVAYILGFVVANRVKLEASNDFAAFKNYLIQISREWVTVAVMSSNFICFALFLFYNGGITFGDKENHRVSFHVMQVFYCFTALTFFTIPAWLSPEVIRRYFKRLTRRSIMNLGIIIMEFLAIKYSIEKFTEIHPFILADNRHYAFYIWRRILSPKFSSIYMIPVYHFSTWNVITSIWDNASSIVEALMFFIAVCLTLIPSPLFELRYYIVPLVIYRISIRPSHDRLVVNRHLLEFAFNMITDVIFMEIFFNYTFEWQSEPGRIQRIIW